jgi:predicted ribosome quality control (RQC) complex YloA/Tae2 family protein
MDWTDLFNFKSSITDTLIDGLIVSAIWQYFSHRETKNREQHLEEKLDNLFHRIQEARDEAKKAKEEAE